MSALTLWQGDTWLRSWAVKGKKTKRPIDLTGATATVRLYNDKKQLIYTASSATGEIVINGLLGQVALEVDKAITAQWPLGLYLFKFRIYYPDGMVRVYEANNLRIQEY